MGIFPIANCFLIGGFGEELHLPLDGGIMIGDELHFVLATTLSTSFMLVTEKHEALEIPCETGPSKKEY